MALQVHAYKISTPRNGAYVSSWSWQRKQTVIKVSEAGNCVRGLSLKVNSTLDGGGGASSASTSVVGLVTEVDKDTFWPLVNSAGHKTVVLDMYTQWCGPCKVIAPKIRELSVKYNDVVFLKLDCNEDNKPLAKELGVTVVPTFKILKDSKIVKEITGVKFDELVAAIEIVRSS